MQRISVHQSGAMMAGDDDSSSDSDYEEQSNLMNGSRKRRGPPEMLFGVVSIPPQQRKLFTLVCVVMALATAFNVATVGYSFQGNRKSEGQGGNYNALNQQTAATADSMGSSMLRASNSEPESSGYSNMEMPQQDIRQEEEADPSSMLNDNEESSAHFQYSSELSANDGRSEESQPVLSDGDSSFDEQKTSAELHNTGSYQQYAHNQEDQPHHSGFSEHHHEEDHHHEEEQHKYGEEHATQTDPFGQVLLTQTELMKQMQEQMKQQQEMFMQMQLQQQQQQQQQPAQTYSPPATTTAVSEPAYTPPATTVAVETPPATTTEESTPASTEVATTTESAAPAADEAPTASVGGPNVDGYKDAWDLPNNPEKDTPVFWHIPKAGGSTVKDIIGTCHRFTLASEAGVAEGHDQDTTVAIVRIGGNAAEGQDPSPFVNVDTTTPAGLQRAKALGLAQSRLADVIVTPYIFDANELFDETFKGRLFTVFRHPVDRAISLFHYLQYADWEPTYSPELANMSLEEYARSPMVENNWMTRYLSNHIAGDLSDQDVAVAMDIVRRKFMVGLLTKKEETMERFEKYFGWKYKINPTNQEICREALLGTGANANTNAVKKEKPKPGDAAYDALAHQNNYDIMLYEYIETLFQEQGQFVQSIPDGYRLEGATCCKCGEPTC